MPRAVGAAVAPAPRFRGVDTTVNDTDLEAFQAIHASVQEAWSNSDLARLRQLMTPEMVGYFSEELTRNASRGVRNVVSNVRLLAGDITESWEEGDLQYATAYMKWSAVDYLARLDRSPGAPDYVAGGDPSRPIESEEVWTFSGAAAAIGCSRLSNRCEPQRDRTAAVPATRGPETCGPVFPGPGGAARLGNLGGRFKRRKIVMGQRL